METISAMFGTYLGWICNWWWLSLAGVTFITLIAYTLIANNRTLSAFKALKLTFVGLFSLLPFICRYIPSQECFTAKWRVLNFRVSFRVFAVVSLFLCLLFSPITFVLLSFVIQSDSAYFYRCSKCDDEEY